MILTLAEIANFVTNYPRIIDGEPRGIKMSVKVDENIAKSFKSSYPDKDPIIGLFVCADALHKGIFISKDALFMDGEKEAKKYCRIKNKFNGYNETEVKIMVHLALGNTILETPTKKVCFIPGQPPLNN